jgi:hypothetical protein
MLLQIASAGLILGALLGSRTVFTSALILAVVTLLL